MKAKLDEIERVSCRVSLVPRGVISLLDIHAVLAWTSEGKPLGRGFDDHPPAYPHISVSISLT